LIDLKEFKVYFRAATQGLVQDPNAQYYAPQIIEEEEKKAVVYRAGHLPPELEKHWFKDLDKDGDGQIGLYEWKNSGRYIEAFKAIDRNDDGFITIAEMLAFMGKNKDAAGTAVASATTPGGPGPGGFN